MNNLDRIKLYLNISLEDGSKDALLTMLMEESFEEIAHYTNRDLEFLKEHPVGKSSAIKAAVVKYNRRGTEGLKSQSFSGSNESYVEGLTAEIRAQLNSLVKIKSI